MRQLTIEGKIIGFKTLTISNVLHRALVKYKPPSAITKLEKIRKQFIWKNGNPKLNHATLSSNLQCSWFKRLYEDSFHSWKGIPLFLIKNHPEKISQFHSNLSIK